MNNKTSLLFLLRKNQGYGGYSGIKAGLTNSANFVREKLEQYGMVTDLKVCFDANSIDKEIVLFKEKRGYKPDFVVLEALWVPPAKLGELLKIHTDVKFIVRVHSKITFLANEGIALPYIRGYEALKSNRVFITFNEETTAGDFKSIVNPVYYLPNIYKDVEPLHIPGFKKASLYVRYLKISAACNLIWPWEDLHVGCFGAIRPMKNQLLQAVAAMEFCNRTKTKLYFYVNGSRLEQGGESVLKNLIALFEGTNHELIQVPWMNHEDFLEYIHRMDIGMQLSLTESFNIVTADFAKQKTPIIASSEISWMPSISKANQLDQESMIRVMNDALNSPRLFITESRNALVKYNRQATNAWLKFIKQYNVK